MKKIILSIIIILAVAFAARTITQALSDVVEIKLRQHTFLIPKRYALERESVMPEWLLNMSGLDDGSNTTLFRFDDKEIKASIADYKISSDNQLVDDIEVLMTALTPKEVNAYRDPNDYAMLGDLWLAKGSYKDRKVEPADTSGWYKVYRAVEYPNSWTLLNRFPDSEKPIPNQTLDFWIAQCLMLGPEGKRGADCRTYELIDDIMIEFRVSDYNLLLLDELKTFVKTKVQEWKREKSD